jgi:hypothetical protein
MADGFKDREKGFEAKWAHDEELSFKVMARRNKLLGLWAAREMGLTGGAADDYAKAVIQAEFRKNGDDDVLHKLSVDFGARKMSKTEQAIRNKMDDLLTIAGEQVLAEMKK